LAVSCAHPVEAPPEVPPAEAGLRLTRTGFEQFPGWNTGAQGSALIAFQRSCARIRAMSADAQMRGAGYGGVAGDWLPACARADAVPVSDEPARAFFESAFTPYRVTSGQSAEGMFTGYYEPELRGSRTRHGEYQTPLYGLPSDLVSIDLGLFRENFAGERISGRLEGNRLVPYATRAEIVRDGLATAEPLVFIDNPTDAFFLQIQGSGRVSLNDGTVVRAAYAGQNGHPYTAIGAVLIRRGQLTRETVSMQSIRAWLDAHPTEAQGLFDENASYVFFSLQPLDDPALGAVGTQGAPLTAEASLAVDASIHPLGAPVWLETAYPVSEAADVPFQRLLVAQDTGGAINGAVRGDIYWGVGERAGEIAGRMRSTGTLTVLVPNEIAARLGGTYPPGAAVP
jgi:membrane-bound lytic murein transglycosylase A